MKRSWGSLTFRSGHGGLAVRAEGQMRGESRRVSIHLSHHRLRRQRLFLPFPCRRVPSMWATPPRLGVMTTCIRTTWRAWKMQRLAPRQGKLPCLDVLTYQLVLSFARLLAGRTAQVEGTGVGARCPLTCGTKPVPPGIAPRCGVTGQAEQDPENAQVKPSESEEVQVREGWPCPLPTPSPVISWGPRRKREEALWFMAVQLQHGLVAACHLSPWHGSQCPQALRRGPGVGTADGLPGRGDVTSICPGTCAVPLMQRLITLLFVLRAESRALAPCLGPPDKQAVGVQLCARGRDKRGGPILTFPARSNHDRIRQEDLRRLISYLACIP
ncbi:hypothetical protein CB1_000318014, partial [Camelus ferus]